MWPVRDPDGRALALTVPDSHHPPSGEGHALRRWAEAGSPVVGLVDHRGAAVLMDRLDHTRDLERWTESSAADFALDDAVAELDDRGGWELELVHWDLHYANVLAELPDAGGGRWLAIDPLPRAGFREAEVVAPLRNRWSDAVATGDPDGAPPRSPRPSPSTTCRGSGAKVSSTRRSWRCTSASPGGDGHGSVSVMTIVEKSFAELSAAELYEILRLRVDVFVVEQECAYPELDGRDLEPATRHLWLADGGTIVAYLRVLRDPDGFRIGRVVTHARHRGGGVGRRLFQAAVDAHSGERIDIEAQSHLAGWYETFGFRVVGEEFLDYGIAHVPMSTA